jgi:hypothetical protein
LLIESGRRVRDAYVRAQEQHTGHEQHCAERDLQHHQSDAQACTSACRCAAIDRQQHAGEFETARLSAFEPKAAARLQSKK